MQEPFDNILLLDNLKWYVLLNYSSFDYEKADYLYIREKWFASNIRLNSHILLCKRIIIS